MMRLLAVVLLLAACDAKQEALSAPRPLEPLGSAAGKGSSPFQFPEELWDAQVSGETLLRLFISEQGAVDSVRVERTSGYEAFDSAALAGSRSLRFEPARRGDEPVGAWFILPVKFDSGAAADSARDPSPKSVVP
ncbi:MAG TPA: energy transducer TonB [Longimicrobium sp.]|nr:energy transducer TonB [Longimicrobium sp.]